MKGSQSRPIYCTKMQGFDMGPEDIVQGWGLLHWESIEMSYVNHFILCYCGTGDWNQGTAYAGQVLYHRTILPTVKLF